MSQPSTQREIRACERKDHIIAAARTCFRRYGFHGAGMAEIAKVSQLSVGQIYRDFTNKDAIIEEIVRRIVTDKMQFIASDEPSFERLAYDLSYRALASDPQRGEDDRALMLEVAAEATRNPRVAQIMRDADERLFRQTSDMLMHLYPNLSAQQIAARVELIAVMSEGTDFRMLTMRKFEQKQLCELYKQIILNVFPLMDT